MPRLQGGPARRRAGHRGRSIGCSPRQAALVIFWRGRRQMAARGSGLDTAVVKDGLTRACPDRSRTPSSRTTILGCPVGSRAPRHERAERRIFCATCRQSRQAPRPGPCLLPTLGQSGWPSTGDPDLRRLHSPGLQGGQRRDTPRLRHLLEPCGPGVGPETHYLGDPLGGKSHRCRGSSPPGLHQEAHHG